MAGPVTPWYRKPTGGNPFSSLGLEWCRNCGEVDTDTDASHRHGIYVYKRTCRRCGRVLKYGAMRAPLLSNRPLPAAALEWVTDPGKDRR